MHDGLLNFWKIIQKSLVSSFLPIYISYMFTVESVEIKNGVIFGKKAESIISLFINFRA